MAAARARQKQGSNRSDYVFISGPRARSTDPHGAAEQVMCPDTAPPARARAGRTASCARHCTLWPLPLPHTGEDVHAADRPHTPRHRVRTLPLWPLVSFPTQLPLWFWPCARYRIAVMRRGGCPSRRIYHARCIMHACSLVSPPLSLLHMHADTDTNEQNEDAREG